MADILIKAVDATHPNPEIDRAGCYKKGDIVEARESGAPRGSLEGLPTFVWVECPEVTKAQVDAYTESWHTILDWAVVARNVAQDGWRLRLFTTNPGAAQEAGITRADMEAWLDDWNAVIVSAAANEVRFDISVFLAATSQQFWGGADISGIGFSEISYDETSGVHRIRADYSMGFDGAHSNVRLAVERRGATNIVQDEALSLIEFDIARSLVTATFKAELKAALEKVYKRCRFSFLPSQVDIVIANGGVMQVTQAQLLAAVQDAQAG